MANHNKKAAAPKANDDTVVYKVMVALIIAVAALAVFVRVRAVYSTAGGLAPVRAGLNWGILIGAIAAVVSGIGCIVLRRRKVLGFSLGMICATGVLTVISCLLFRVYWVTCAGLCYYLWVAAALVFCLYQLYQREFFVIGLLTAAAGGVFYCTSSAFSAAFSIAANLVLIVLCLLTAAAAFALTKTEGTLKLGSKTIQLFSKDFSAFPLYIVSVLWALCAVATLILGSAFAYYCIYAAVGVALVAICYYTIKLM